MKKYTPANKKYFLATNKYLILLSISFLLSIAIMGVQAQIKSVAISKNTKPVKIKTISKMLGADISFLPQLEYKGIKFTEWGMEKNGKTNKLINIYRKVAKKYHIK